MAKEDYEKLLNENLVTLQEIYAKTLEKFDSLEKKFERFLEIMEKAAQNLEKEGKEWEDEKKELESRMAQLESENKRLQRMITSKKGPSEEMIKPLPEIRF